MKPCCWPLRKRYEPSGAGSTSPFDTFAMLVQVSDYLVGQNELDKLAGVALRRLHHFYYKTGIVFSAFVLDVCCWLEKGQGCQMFPFHLFGSAQAV